MSIHSFPPILSPTPKVLILGTMPSVKSLEESFYYGHPRNAFWPIWFALLETPFSNLIEDKRKLIEENHLALWDVLRHCEREGSLDSNIQNEVPNDIPLLLQEYPSIQKIAFNGQPAARFFKRHLSESCSIAQVTLPSTSPAHASKTVVQKQEEWRTLLQDLFPE